MSMQIEGVLRDAITTSIEGLAFTFAEADESTVIGEGMQHSTVEFDGPFTGLVCVSVEPPALQAIASSMMATDEVCGLDVQLDALGELTNVTTGNLLPGLGRAADVFALAPPISNMRTDDDDVAARIAVTINEGRLVVSLHCAQLA